MRHMGFGVRSVDATSKSSPSVVGCRSTQRLSTDPWFYSTVSFTNVVTGSRYRIERESDGYLFLSGLASSTDFSVEVPIYSNTKVDTILTQIKIRNASGTPAYTPFEPKVILGRFGASIYVEQEVN